MALDVIEKRLGEIGSTGTVIQSGVIDKDEWVTDLTGPVFFDTVDRMRTDAIISAIERGFFLPIKQGNYSIKYPEPDIEKDPKKKEQLDFIKKNFDRLNMPFILHNACLALPYGFSLFEIILQEINGQLWLQNLSPRLQKTVYAWKVDRSNNLMGIKQQVYQLNDDGVSGNWAYPEIPAEKLLLITHQMEGGNFEGRSAYRPFYREYKVKDKALKQSVITIDRVGGGIPFARVKDDAPDTAGGVVGTVDQVKNVIRSIQGNESAHMVFKLVEEIGMLTIHPEALKALFETVVKYCDETISKSAFQMFLSLGTSSSGSRALGDTFVDLYFEALGGIASESSASFSNQLIRRLIDWNYGKQEVYPQFGIEFKRDITPLIETLATLKEKGLFEGNRDIENYVLDVWGLPLTNDSNRLPPAEKKIVPITQSDKKPAGKKRIKMSSKNYGFKHIKFCREPNEMELSLFNFQDTFTGLDSLIESLSKDLRRAVEPALVDAAAQIGKGEKIYNVKITYGNKVSDIFRKYYKRLYEITADQTKKDLIKQNKQMSEKILFNAKTEKSNLLESYRKWSDEQANIDSEILGTIAKEDMLNYLSAGTRQGLTGKDLSAFIIDQVISEVGKRYEDAAGSITGAYAMVREISMEEHMDIIQNKVWTAMMDTGTCGECIKMDGTTFGEGDDVDGTWDDAPELPYERCEGEPYNHCRCIYIYRVK